MANRKKIIDAIDSFYEDIIDAYKEMERQIAGESRLLTMFKKVNYKARITKFKDLKKKAQGINVKKIEIDKDDELAAEVREKLAKSVSLFVDIINVQVSFQTLLLKKSEGEKVSMVDYKKAAYNVQKATEALQNALRNMDADYANLEENE
jgi:hypothetical protein